MTWCRLGERKPLYQKPDSNHLVGLIELLLVTDGQTPGDINTVSHRVGKVVHFSTRHIFGTVQD